MKSVLFGVALVLPIALAASPAAAQTDPAARALIQQLLPRTSVETTRGIRPVGPAAGSATAPTPAAAPATSSAPIVAAPPPPPSASRTAATAPRAPEPPRATTAPVGVAAASITVTFPSGSADLTPDAMAALRPLGEALASSDLAAFRFRIEGHTDSVGPRDANQSLSERRAAAVRDHLVQRYGVDPRRVETVGRGEGDLLVPTADEVAERRNRRVQVVNLGG
ncbi:MAG TPA: OmpA family protein [Falsiroseomonas sp.]|jgi:outer membrane protein OmpA-like peptidoglycan-associated protein|nr:OmpA family protein [Falsiroseomonas sp.]